MGMKISKERIVPVVLVFCVLLVAFWEIMSSRSRSPFRPFLITADDFKGFAPASSSFFIKPLKVPDDPIEPNILVYSIRPHNEKNREAGSVMTRLVHGYNMRDCMRIKGYQVDLIGTLTGGGVEAGVNSGKKGWRQVWRLKSDAGDVAIWVTSILRAGDFLATDIDVRSMAFPRVGVPDDPGWLPQGFTWKSFRHPLINFQKLLRTKWSNSRCDPAVFLRLKQPAWASDELLTLVTASETLRAGEKEEDAEKTVVSVHDFMLCELQRWREERVF